MKRASRAALLALVAVVPACSRPNLQSTGGGYEPCASAPSVETSVDEPAAAEAATDTTGR